MAYIPRRAARTAHPAGGPQLVAPLSSNNAFRKLLNHVGSSGVAACSRQAFASWLQVAPPPAGQHVLGASVPASQLGTGQNVAPWQKGNSCTVNQQANQASRSHLVTNEQVLGGDRELERSQGSMRSPVGSPAAGDHSPGDAFQEGMRHKGILHKTGTWCALPGPQLSKIVIAH